MRNQNSFKLFISSLIVFSSLVANAAFYEERPSVLKVPAKSDSKVEDWKIASHGHFLFLAQTLTFFPTSEYYFLARDIEYVYDLAQIMAKDDPVLKQRIHLVPVSTVLSHQTEDMIKYLEQEGLTKKNLGGRSALFVDSCCSGSVPDRIDNAFKSRGVTVQGFLIQTEKYPSSAMATTAGADGGAIEDLPHFSDSADMYVKQNGKIKIHVGQATPKEKAQSLAIMGQIRHDFDNAQKRKEFKELVGLMRSVFSYTVPGSAYKTATREQAIKALQVMGTKYAVPVADFLEDIKHMSRKKYIGFQMAKLLDLRKATAGVHELAQKEIAKKAAFEPDNLDTYLNKTSLTAETIIATALEVLTESSAKELGLTDAKHSSIMKKWLNHFDNHSYSMSLKDDVLIKVLSIGYSPADSLDKIYEFVREQGGSTSYYSEFDNKKFTRIVIDILTKDDYRYEKGSALYKVINGFGAWDKASDSFRPILENVIENADDALLEKLSVDLFKKLPDFADWHSDQDKIERDVNKVMKKLIDSLPTISKPMIVSYLKSSMTQNRDSKYYRDFAKWLFEQRDYFDAEALKVSIDSETKRNLPGQSQVPKSGTRVEHFVDVHAGPLPLPVVPLKGLKGQLCSRIYSGK